MRRFALGLLVAVCLAASAAPSGAATLFGNIDSPPEGPSIVQGANSAFLVTGWAAGSGGVGRVDVLVDGQIVASTNTFGQRPDVQATYPALPNSLNSGWFVYIDSTALINGMHTISAVAVGVSSGGGTAPETAVLGTRDVQVDNASLNLHPFGELQYPLDESTMRSICGVAPPSGPTTCQVSPCVNPGEQPPFTLTIRRSDLNPVSGWVLDTGARGDLGQTAYVQLLIDGVIIADTRQDCVLINGGFANCYGLNRPDVEKQFPGFVNSDDAGYVFDFAAVDDGSGNLSIYVPVSSTVNESNVGVRSVTTIVPGKHDISIRAGDVAETVSQIGTPISVIFTLPEDNLPAVLKRLHDGAKTASLTLIGTYATSNFKLSGDGHGGTFIKDPGPHPAAARTVQAAASLALAPAGPGGGSVGGRSQASEPSPITAASPRGPSSGWSGPLSPRSA